QRQQWGTTTRTALRSLHLVSGGRENQDLLQQVGKLVSQRRRTRLDLRKIAFCLYLCQCGIMHDRKSFRRDMNSHERIVLLVPSGCNSILHLVVPNGLAPVAVIPVSVRLLHISWPHGQPTSHAHTTSPLSHTSCHRSSQATSTWRGDSNPIAAAEL